jgi:tetratricopeptide (TPR) repeat protein
LGNEPATAPAAASSPFAGYRDTALEALGRATRHACAALETALAGPPLWDHVTAWLPAARGHVFRQQMDALLDLLSLAGLEAEDPDARRRCREELRAARRTGQALAPEPAGTEAQALAQLAGDLEQAGLPHLAGLVQLRLPWDEPLFLGMADYFLRRGTPGRMDLPNDHPAACWRCLETAAGLLQEKGRELEELLDRPEGAGAGSGKRRDDAAIERLYQLGLGRFLHGDYQQAALHFTAALKLDPANSQLYAQRGDAYRLQCEYERAIADFDVALRLGPASPSTLVSRAIAYHLSREYDRAVADCTGALQISPNHPGAHRTRAAAHAERGATGPALADLTEALSQAPDDDEALYQRGILYARKREYGRAVADFNRVLQVNHYRVAALMHRGDAHRCRNDHRRAIRDYTEVLKHHPSNVVAYTSRGLAYRLQGDRERALADFTSALRLEPGNAQACYSRGVLYRLQGDLDRALADLDEAARRQPENWAALYHRSKVHLGQSRLEEALADLDGVVRLNPKLAVAYLSRALTHYRLGRHAAALGDAARAVELDERSPAAYLVRGVLQAHTGQYTAAVADLGEAITRDERLALAYQERGLAYALQGDYDRALDDCDRLIALEPGLAQAYANRSIFHHFKGHVQQALMDYAQALQLDGRCVLLGWNQGLAEAARGQTTQRLADYIDGLRPEPAAAEAPPPPDFQIVFRPPEAREPAPGPAPTAHRRRKGGGRAARRSDKSTTVHRPAGGKETATHLRASEETVEAAAPERAPAEAEQDEPELVLDESAVEKAADDDGPELILNLGGGSTAGRAAAEEVELALEDLLTEDEEPSAPAQIRPAVGGTAEAPPAAPTQASAPAVTCPLCRRTGPPAEHLPGGRFRCAGCKAVFAWTPAAPPPAADTGKKRRKKPRRSDDEDEGILRRWVRPVPLAVGGIAALILLYLGFPMRLFGTSDRLKVFPARGQITFAGKPMSGAMIVLHPAGGKDPDFPRPRAVVGDDGSFVLGTYASDDGAPPGEYQVAVQWFRKARRDKNAEVEGGGQTAHNVLPARYGRPETSGLTVHIQEGENQLPALQLR